MQTQETDTQPFEILLVEDNPGDVRLIKEAFNDAKTHVLLHVVSDGVEAIDFLRGERQGNGSRPD